MAEEVDIYLRLQELQRFVSGTREAATSVRQIGTAARTASSEAMASARRVPGVIENIGRAARLSATGFAAVGRGARAAFTGVVAAAGTAVRGVRARMLEIRGLMSRPLMGGGALGMLAGTALTFASVKGIKDAIDNTAQLGVTSAATAKIMGTSTQTMADWFALAQAHGVNIRTLSMSFRAMATQINGFENKSKASVQLFKDMGISMADVKKHSNDMNGTMMMILDHLNKMPGGATKTYVATRLLGRGWQALMPLLGQGSAHIREQQKLAERLGIRFDGSAKSAMKLHNAQVTLRLAGIGLQVVLANYLVPAFTWLIGESVKLYGWLRVQLGPTFKWLSGIVRDASQWLKQHRDVWKILGQVIKTVIPYVLGFVTVMKVLNIVMRTNPVLLIAAAVIGLATAFIYAYKHSTSFRNTVNKVLRDVATVARWAWNNVIHPVVIAANWFFRNVLGPTIRWFGNHWRDIWNAIKTVIKVAWTIIHPIITLIGFGIKAIGVIASAMWHIVKPAFSLMGAIIGAMWRVVQPILSALWSAIKTVGDIINWMWNNVAKPAFNLIGGAISTMWTVVGPILNFMKNVFQAIGDVIQWVVNKIRDFINAITSIPTDVLNTLGQILGVGVTQVRGGTGGNLGYGSISPAGLPSGGLPGLVSGGGGGGTPPILPAPSSGGGGGKSNFGANVSRVHRNVTQIVPLNSWAGLQVEVPVNIHGREVARASGKVVTDRLARK